MFEEETAREYEEAREEGALSPPPEPREPRLGAREDAVPAREALEVVGELRRRRVAVRGRLRHRFADD